MSSDCCSCTPDLVEPVYAFVSVASAVTCSALLLCSVLLLHAAYNDERPGFLIPWLVADSVMICIQTTVLVSDGFLLAASGQVAHGLATVIVVSAALGNALSPVYTPFTK